MRRNNMVCGWSFWSPAGEGPMPMTTLDKNPFPLQGDSRFAQGVKWHVFIQPSFFFFWHALTTYSTWIALSRLVTFTLPSWLVWGVGGGLFLRWICMAGFRYILALCTVHTGCRLKSYLHLLYILAAGWCANVRSAKGQNVPKARHTNLGKCPPRQGSVEGHSSCLSFFACTLLCSWLTYD